MGTALIVRAWTDPDYRASLTPDELAALPAHPSGSLDEELEAFLAFGAQSAATTTCTHTCTSTCSCTATQYSPRPCCC